VRSTEALLRLASRRSGVVLHHVSTIAVFPPAPAGVVAREDDEPAPVDLFTGYAQSKWVAERLVRLAGERGVPVVVYRPGNIAGHSTTGAWNAADFARGFIKGCIQLGCVPDLDITWDLTPVDYVSAALVRLSLRPEAVGERFHLVNPNPRPLGEIVELLAELGYPMRRVSYPAWRDALEEARRRDQDNVLVPLLDLFSDELPRRARLARFDCRSTLAALEGSDVVCPPVGRTLLGTYLEALRGEGFLPVQAQVAVA
jgi:thioester reductase-like protein